MTARKLNVSVLYYQPPTVERDEVVDQVAEALGSGGHEVSFLKLNDNLNDLLSAVKTQKPDIIFNLCETFAGRDIFEMHIAAVLDLLGQRYTGSGPVGLALRQDKALTKRLLRFYNSPCSGYAVFDKRNLELDGRMRFPLFVKPLHGDASLCVDEYSIARDMNQLLERSRQIQDELHQSALVEEYIEGRELYVSLLGNDPPSALPIVEMDFSGLPPGEPHIYDLKAKFKSGTPQYEGTKAVIADNLQPETRHRVEKVALDTFHALGLSDYARVDIRLSPDGIPFVIEVNANPYLENTSEFAQAASAGGLDFASLIENILTLSWERWEMESSSEILPRTSLLRKTKNRRNKLPPSCPKVD